jgi:hypothetical protein
MNLTMFKRLATDVASPIAALLVFVAILLAISLLLEMTGAIDALQHWGQSLQTHLNPTFPREQ